MARQKLLIGGALALALAAGACNRDAKDTRKEAIKEDVKAADKAAAVEKERSDEIARLSDRVAQLERAYSEKTAVLATGKRIATPSLREEVQEDVDNVKQAVTNLSTTTADNWWEREEGAMRATIDDVAADVKRFAGHVAEPAPAAPGETPASAPFTSRRDAFVAAMKGRIDALDRALDTVKVKGARETELNDTRQRVKKIAGDLDRLAGASADDWWTVSRDRVRDYIDRVEASVRRLDDNKPHT
ncbi:MAG TPA: hypothetical protein VGQ37_18195 [Vicinamibacterales bacterium]|nr:hypothetical protein [Vicinamibacterales bacterium]